MFRERITKKKPKEISQKQPSSNKRIEITKKKTREKENQEEETLSLLLSNGNKY